MKRRLFVINTNEPQRDNYKSKIEVGQRFGRLINVSEAAPAYSPSGQKLRKWICKCDCGKTKLVLERNLARGQTRSCGCLRDEVRKTINKTHGMTKTRIYKIWDMMRQRCNNPNDTAYAYYGGRNIKVCKEWDDFLVFYDWSVKNGYDDKLTIDRIDNNGNYEPSNCQWATLLEQANNKRNNFLITYLGKTQTVPQWARETGIGKDTIYRRLKRYGWDAGKALTQPARKWTHRKGE